MNRTAAVIAVAASAGLLAGLRLAGERSQAFQAAAHLEVGALLGWSVAGRTWYPAVVAVVLSLIELAAFFLLPR